MGSAARQESAAGVRPPCDTMADLRYRGPPAIDPNDRGRAGPIIVDPAYHIKLGSRLDLRRFSTGLRAWLSQWSIADSNVPGLQRSRLPSRCRSCRQVLRRRGPATCIRSVAIHRPRAQWRQAISFIKARRTTPGYPNWRATGDYISAVSGLWTEGVRGVARLTRIGGLQEMDSSAERRDCCSTTSRQSGPLQRTVRSTDPSTRTWRPGTMVDVLCSDVETI